MAAERGRAGQAGLTRKALLGPLARPEYCDGSGGPEDLESHRPGSPPSRPARFDEARVGGSGRRAGSAAEGQNGSSTRRESGASAGAAAATSPDSWQVPAPADGWQQPLASSSALGRPSAQDWPGEAPVAEPTVTLDGRADSDGLGPAMGFCKETAQPHADVDPPQPREVGGVEGLAWGAARLRRGAGEAGESGGPLRGRHLPMRAEEGVGVETLGLARVREVVGYFETLVAL